MPSNISIGATKSRLVWELEINAKSGIDISDKLPVFL